MAKRKLPDPAIVDRLYWLDGLSTHAIAAQFGVTQHAVIEYMRRHRIPRRHPGRWRPIAICMECDEPVCRVKMNDKKRGGYKWVQSHRCAMHQILKDRHRRRERMRRVLNIPPERYRPRKNVPLVSSWVRS